MTPDPTGPDAAAGDGGPQPSLPALVAALAEYSELRHSGLTRAQILARRPDLGAVLQDMLAESSSTTDDHARAGATEEIRPLRRIGDFALLRELGHGGMGVVYEAEQVSVRRRVALKLLPGAAGLDERALARFRREARLCATAQHPGIARVLVVGDDDGQHYMAMELIPGVPLSRVLRELGRAGGPPSEATPYQAALEAELVRAGFGGGPAPARAHDTYVRVVVKLVATVADALEHVHALGVIHRDVKPGNILVRADGEPVLADFGVAREQQELGVTFTGELPGTAYYRAPEQHLVGQDRLDGRADVFALGITLYEALTLVRPFAGETAAAVGEQICHARPPDPRRRQPGIDADLCAVLLMALHKDRRDRYPSARALAEDLRRWLERRPVLARPMPVGRRLWRWIGRNPVATAIGLVFATLTVALLWALAQARANLRLFDLMAVGPRCDELQREVAGLPPPLPEHVKALGDAARALSDLVAQREAVAGAARGLRTINPTAAKDLYQLAGRLDEIAARELRDVQRRLEWAESRPEAATEAAWGKVLADLAEADGTRVHAGYVRCRDLQPQHGLVPLRIHPQWRLWEFWFPPSGERPEVGPKGAWHIGPDSGMVLVLLPPGTVSSVKGKERVQIPALFVGAHELTQGQWDRLCMAGQVNPSLRFLGGLDVNGASPAQNCSLEQARAVLGRWGCSIPTEEEWWYLATAGVETPWWLWPVSEKDVSDGLLTRLSGFANLSDYYAKVIGIAFREIHPFEDRLQDGHAFPAEVGRFEANEFGLHDVLGNVREMALAGEALLAMGGSFAARPDWSCLRTDDRMPASDGVHDTGVRAIWRVRR